MAIGIVAVIGVFGVLALGVVVVLVLVLSVVKDRRSWRGPGLTALERTRPDSELQDPAGQPGPSGPAGEGSTDAWNLAQLRTHQAGNGTPLGPF
jgi:hypothetical protein